MNCGTHVDTPAVAYCRTCGTGLCAACRQEWRGVIYCGPCAATQQAAFTAAPPRAPAPGPDTLPGLAFALGLIPGVGAIYNGQYGKGIIHVVVLGILISILNSDAAGDLTPLFGLMIPAWILYMALEAYHTAKKRAAGYPVDEFSGLFPSGPQPGRIPLGPLALILLGFLFLLNTLNVLQLRQIVRFWPLLLIAAGAYWLYARVAGRPAGSQETAPGSGEPPAAGPV